MDLVQTETTVKYALLIYDDEVTFENMSEAEQAAIFQEHGGLAEKLAVKGAFLAGEQLAPTATATTIRTKGGKSIVMDGPFAESKEYLTGFYLIEADSLEEAQAYAKMLSGTVEVRACVAS